MSDGVVGAGRVAVVTGAASGIGRALALAFAGEGMAVVLADVDAGPLDVAAADVRETGAATEAMVIDVTDATAVDRLARTTVERFGRVDVLCNNAGVSTFNLLADQTLADHRWVYDVNLWGVVHGIHAFLPIMREQGTPAHIVNTSSLGGLMGGVPFIGPYVATKAAVIALSETLRVEMQMLGLPIGVSVLCPGSTDTNVMESERVRPGALGMERRSEQAEVMRRTIKETFTGPTGTTPDAVAQMVLVAIRADAPYVISSPWERSIVQARFDAIMAHFPPVPAEGGQTAEE